MFDRWAEETLPLAGECFRQVTKTLLWRNALLKGEMQLDGRRIDLSNIKAPLLSIIAQHDHIVPHPAAHPIMELVGSSEREEIIVKGGHVSIVAGLGAVKRLWPSIDRWLGRRSV
jgi:polyhydroxyalkanoate synthase